MGTGFKHSEEYINIKELTKRFAHSFGLDAVKNRDAIQSLSRWNYASFILPLEFSRHKQLKFP